ncbi:hypothetical protein [Streptomyces koyangensis]|uniref:Uncharacterized protein n=1 Tax=Streptomyces koyangensis TaxID=188770 RepID=A0A385D4W8_9ACTN|nr:hypothetical protein [Streptomyces koyangensis]AXQ53428.1 hypothetical protein D0C37_01445 [Streptomyces koyangensis]
MDRALSGGERGSAETHSTTPPPTGSTVPRSAVCSRGELSPRALAFWAHRSHGHELPLTARLAELDDAYDLTEYGDSTLAELDTEVTAEARRPAAGS